MDALAARLADEFPSLNRGRGITVVGGGQVRVHPEIDGALVSAAGLLLVIVGLVLVLACANLANLLIVRGIFRGPEMGIVPFVVELREWRTPCFLYEVVSMLRHISSNHAVGRGQRVKGTD